MNNSTDAGSFYNSRVTLFPTNGVLTGNNLVWDSSVWAASHHTDNLSTTFAETDEVAMLAVSTSSGFPAGTHDFTLQSVKVGDILYSCAQKIELGQYLQAAPDAPGCVERSTNTNRTTKTCARSLVDLKFHDLPAGIDTKVVGEKTAVRIPVDLLC